MTKKFILQADVSWWVDMSEEDKQKAAENIVKIVKWATIDQEDDTPEEDEAGLKSKRDGYREQEKRVKEREEEVTENQTKFKIFDSNEDILQYDFNYNKAETENISLEFTNIRNGKDDITIHNLRRVALWKLDRVMNVPESVFVLLDSLAKSDNIDIQDPKIEMIVTSLLECEWIGFPMASAILKFLRPDIFPIIDVRAYRAIYGKKIYSSQYTFTKYLAYIKKIYEIRDKTGRNLEEIDQQLYEFDKKYNWEI